MCKCALPVFVGWPWLSFGRWKGRVNWHHYEASALRELNYCLCAHLSQVREKVRKNKTKTPLFLGFDGALPPREHRILWYSSSWTSLAQFCSWWSVSGVQLEAVQHLVIGAVVRAVSLPERRRLLVQLSANAPRTWLSSHPALGMKDSSAALAPATNTQKSTDASSKHSLTHPLWNN